MKIKQYFKWAILIIALLGNTISYAEIITDGSLGAALSLSSPDYLIGSELGQQYGGNLFHSFRQFNLSRGESATFSGPVSVKNIINRVTGGERSTIDGLIRSTISNANLYLLNPAGILFGENAELNITGSFHVSTADYLRFSDGGRFYATNPANSLLTVAPVEAFGFLDAAAPISIEGSHLAVPNDHSLSLVGGDINIKNSELFAPDGFINLASVASEGELKIMAKNLRGFQNLGGLAPQLGQIKISGSKIGNDTHVPANGAQSIYIRGGEFWVDNSVINARVHKERIGDAADGIRIDVRDTVTLKSTNSYKGIATILLADTNSATDASNIIIDTAHLMMHDNVSISNDTKDSGAAGNITIRANDITMTDEAEIGSHTNSNGNIGGNIKITATDFLRMSDDTQIDAMTRGTNKKAGVVEITAGDIKMYGEATINVGTYTSSGEGSGDGGETIINAHTLTITDKADIFSSSFSKGQGGHIRITVDDLKLMEQGAIASTAFSEGQGGNIDIQANDTLYLSQDAVINASTEGVGSGGNVKIQANQVVIKANALISTASEITNASAVNENEDALIDRIAGLIERAIGAGVYAGNDIFNGGGEAGSITIKANNISLADGAAITGFSGGIGLAGNIEITVDENLNLQASKISTAAAKADGGNIRLQTKGLINLYDSAITATVGGGAGDGGNINIGKIIAPKHVILNNGKIIANAFEGDGGNIYIVTDNLLQSIESAITASSEKGIDGTVYIESPEDELGEGAFIQPKDFFDARRLSPKECETHNPRNNKFIIHKRDGVHKSPDDMAH